MKKHIYQLFGLFMVIALLPSCLKDDSLVLNPDESHNVIEFDDISSDIEATGAIYTLYHTYVDVSSAIDVPVTVSYSGPEAVAPRDIVVELVVADTSVIAAYNHDQDPDTTGQYYEMMDANLFSVGATSVTIPKGETKATTTITVKSDQFDFTKKYVVPMKIVSSSYGEISGNFSTILVHIAPRNEYEGDYLYTYESNLGSGKDEEVTLKTAGQFSLSFNLINYYSNMVYYRIDPTTNKVTVEDRTELGTVATDPSSHYDPDTKTLYVKWTGGGGGYIFEETFVRQ